MYSLDLTAGYGKPNNDDMQHYHIMVDQLGNLFAGYHKISDNVNCKDGNYAEHCALGNTGTIGIALCGMLGFNTKTRFTKVPITQVQVEKACEKIANLCKEYNIPIDSSHVYTHMEYDQSPNGAKDGKIDIVFIPYNHVYGKDEVGNFLREKVKWYYNKIK